MCGIAGIYNYRDSTRPIDRGLLERMTRLLAHRGPDGEGFHVEGPIGLGHRRLAIVDLTPTGHQPMSNDDGSCWLTYNGEFYNHADFRSDLGHQYSFRGTSDTETLLRLLEKRGADALRDVVGIFGFAFWDRRRRTLILARDHLGVKQVYYYDDGERILFASEMKALLACGDISRELDPEAVNQYLHFHTALSERTFFRHIRQLRPAEYLTASASGTARQLYWKIDQFSDFREPPDRLVVELKDQLARVVRDQLMADVPVGSFFSGGIDSSAIASFAKLAGKPPLCFGVHFSNQGVIDERPFQIEAAEALGLELELTTLDGTSFPEDIARTLYHQDEPTIGAAMLPMYHVSRMARRRVPVCLGGQAADEIFGGYARYALTQPLQVVGQWISGLQRRAGALHLGDGESGNLRKQLFDFGTLKRLASDARHFGDWRGMYFAHFTKVPESAWRDLVEPGEILSRASCRATFDQVLDDCPARSPSDKILYWDVQTYLPGLFHQEDRMSMANSVESRVPFADPRLVEFAFRCDFNVKFREGASKWILRQAVADAIPKHVLSRRKVGFDTPAESWIRDMHADFVRDTLLSRRARERGLWKSAGIERLLDNPLHSRFWFDRVWKVLCIEIWAQLFQDQPSPPSEKVVYALASESVAPTASQVASSIGSFVQEVRELGVRGTLFRSKWEANVRSGAVMLSDHRVEESRLAIRSTTPSDWANTTADAMEPIIGKHDLARLETVATNAARGRILCFGRWYADFGSPIDWHLNPTNGRSWDANAHWSRALSRESSVGDVKFSWEVGRFPQAFYMARAATFVPAMREHLIPALADQMRQFIADNPYSRGLHWNSGQEIALRLLAWYFAFGAWKQHPAMQDISIDIANAFRQGTSHIQAHINYARKAVYNNHLLSEALGLLLGASAVPDSADAPEWRRLGLRILGEEARRQFYEDGAYIQQSHNYHRAAMAIYLMAAFHERSHGAVVPEAWTSALKRSLDFLVAQQSPVYGHLPNYGSNDGSQFCILSTCDYPDFRPVLQATSVEVRGERLYDPGAWDEMAVWLNGPQALELPLRPPKRTSVSFRQTGYHVLRGHDPSSFATFRCGPIPDRFSQIDMLHLDVWWRGVNVLADAGTYLYNGPEAWHRHFVGTECHNTLTIDGRDQMLHFRRFKTLHRCRGTLLRFQETEDWSLCEGEHDGYRRHPGRCIHRRTVLFVKDDAWIVVDRVAGTGTHDIRLHWLGGELPFEFDRDSDLVLKTPLGQFHVAAFDEHGASLKADVVCGRNHPPRGWSSRHYGERVPVPSFAVHRRAEVPVVTVSVLSADPATVSVVGTTWSVAFPSRRVQFELSGESMHGIRVSSSAGSTT